MSQEITKISLQGKVEVAMKNNIIYSEKQFIATIKNSTLELRSPNSNNIYSDDVIGNVNCGMTINFNNGNMTINGQSIKDLIKSTDTKTKNEEEKGIKEYDLSGCMIKKIDLSGQSSFFSSFNESLVILRKIDCSGQSFVSLSNLGLK